MTYSKFFYLIKPLCKKMPWLWEKSKKLLFFKNKFLIIRIGNIDIYMDDGPLRDHRGIGRVSRELLSQLKLKGLLVNNLKPEEINPGRIKVFFYTSIHYCPRNLPHPSAVIIHDVIPLLFPQYFSKMITYEWINRYKSISHQVSKVISISHSSARDIAKKLDLEETSIEVIYNGVSTFKDQSSSKLKLPQNSFILFIGSLDDHKNLDVVLRALTYSETRNIDLVVIGDDNGYINNAKALGIKDRVHFFGILNDNDVAYIMKHALALVLPSLYEGFGLTPLEAAKFKVPSICSKRPAMTEILDKAAIFVEPHLPYNWALAISKLEHNPDLRVEIGHKAFQISQNYTWEKAADKLIDCLTKVAMEYHVTSSSTSH